MRRIFLLLCLVLSFVSCEKDPVVNGFPVDKTDIVLDWDSSEVTINFDLPIGMHTKLEHTITIESGTYNWITFNSSTQTSATFTVKNNLQHIDRSAVIRIKNDSYSDFTEIRVMQKCAKEELLHIDVSDITTSAFNVTVTAKDENMEIFTYVQRLRYGKSIEDRPYDRYLEDGTELSSVAYYDFVLYALREGLDVREFMVEQGVLGTGVFEREEQLAEPNAGYCIITVGVELYEDEHGATSVRAVTPAYNHYIMTEHTPVREDIKLSVTVDLDQVYSSDALLSIECDEDSNLLYRYMVVEPSTLPLFMEEYTQDEAYDFFSYMWYNEFISYASDGMEYLEAFLEANTFAESFEDERLRLTANTEYCVIAYALDVVEGTIQMVSSPEIVRFTTGKCGVTDVSFELTENEIHGRMVDFTITPSNDMAGYYTTILTKEEYDSWDKTLLRQRLVDEGWAQGAVRYGASDYEFRFLNPETEYYVVCVGAHGGVATTEDVTAFLITTPMQAEPKCKIVGFDCYGPFYAGALNDYDPTKYHMNGSWINYYLNDYCAVGVDIHTEGEVYQLYANFIGEDQIEGCSDNQIIAMLQDRDCMPKIYYYCKENITFRYYIVAMDEDGNIDLYKSPDTYYFTHDDYITDEASIAELAKFYDEVKAQHEGTRSANLPTTRAADSGEQCISVID